MNPHTFPVRLQTLLLDYWQRLRHLGWRGVLLLLALPPALLLAYALLLIPFTPGISDLRKAKQEQPARILSADGKELAVFKRANREWVKLAQVSPRVVEALIATEDHRFYQHHGIDWRRTVGAALNTFSGDRQGGSTLTQQLARNLYPDEIGRAPTLTRKLKEAITALKIEALYTKEEILETYLNTVPFLYNAYGIEMAARTYFDTSAGNLDVLQSATLVGMLKGNSYYNPVLNPERAVQRRNTVLAQMVKRERLSPAQFDGLKKNPLRLDFERQSEPEGPAPHFAQQLRKWLIAWADDHGYNAYADGLVVYTTLDSRLQTWANQAVARQGYVLQNQADAAWNRRGGWNAANPLVRTLVGETPEYRSAVAAGLGQEEALKKLLADKAFMAALRQQKTRIQAGFLALDPRNGQVRAWVGSRDFSQDAFDHVQQAKRQPGSTFKPFVYGAAFLRGAQPGDSRMDQAVEIPLAGGEIWRPADHEPPSNQPITLATALALSKNTVTAQLMQEVGAVRVARLAQAMGIRQSRLETVPSLALGTSPVSLREMVAAYGTIANGGGYLEPVLVSRIENGKGKILAEFAPADPEPALPPKVAYTLVDTMRGVIDRGTGSAIRSRFGIRADVAGKTGTTQDNTDGWFILMHPQLVAGAWVGFNDARITLRSDYWGQGAHSALPMVGDFFQQALRSRQIDAKARFAEPEDSNLFTRVLAWGRDWLTQLLAPAPEAPPPHSSRRAPAPTSPPPQPEPLPVEPPPAPPPEEANRYGEPGFNPLAPPPPSAPTPSTPVEGQ
ncbi:penicillin-binding protein 1A [Azospira sp.]|uniref:penicillin-binding protein 1A n=1 Tax=Azospira sp. TaxID=1872671 RepID=UPI00256A4FA7|nr:transglycosylase domain-containing protein [Azospira sp.]MDK9691594.1 transglycosylase domain-containing protein [Azospira sp.]